MRKFSQYLILFFLIATISSEVVSAERLTSFYLVVDSESYLNMQQIGVELPKRLAKHDLVVEKIRVYDSNQNIDQLNRVLAAYSEGETAKIVAIVSAETPVGLSANALKSFPVNVVMKLYDSSKNQTATTRARGVTQHIEASSATTPSFLKAIEQALNNVSDKLADLPPPANQLTPNADSSPKLEVDKNQGLVISENVPDLNPINAVNKNELIPDIAVSLKNHCDASWEPNTMNLLPKTVTPGTTIEVVSCYPVLGESKERVELKTEIATPTGGWFTLKYEAVWHSQGVRQSDFEFQIPLSYPKGRYKVKQSIVYTDHVFSYEDFIDVEHP